MYSRCTRLAHNMGLYAAADIFLWLTKSILAPSEARNSILLCLQQSLRIKAGLFILKLKVIKLKGMGRRRRAARRRKWVMRVIFSSKRWTEDIVEKSHVYGVEKYQNGSHVRLISIFVCEQKFSLPTSVLRQSVCECNGRLHTYVAYTHIELKKNSVLNKQVVPRSLTICYFQ